MNGTVGIKNFRENSFDSKTQILAPRRMKLGMHTQLDSGISNACLNLWGCPFVFLIKPQVIQQTKNAFTHTHRNLMTDLKSLSNSLFQFFIPSFIII